MLYNLLAMFSVLQDHKDFLLINKSPGVGFHKDGETEGLTATIRTKLGIQELYAVHRLDSVTSGLILFAKKIEVAKDLSRQFRQRQVEKYYLAISDQRPKKKQGLIKGDLEKARRGAWKLSRTLNNPSVTQFFSYSLGDGLRLFVLKPYTGKTHQLRVAMKSIGSPVLGDTLYHKKEADDVGPDRAYLHSYAIRFHVGEREYSFICKPSNGLLFANEIFHETLKRCEIPWLLKWPSIK